MSQKQLNEQLYLVTSAGDIKQVKLFIEQGADVNYHNPDMLQATPLIAASQYGQIEVVSFLLQSGGNPNATNKINWTPLHYAAQYGETEVAVLLINNGANLDAVDESKNTPLHKAAYHGHSDVADILIKAGASLDAVNNNMITPLHDAICNGRTEVVALLIKSRANLDAVDKSKNTPLHWAAYKGYSEIAQMLINSGALLDAIDKNKRTPLHVAARNGKTEVATLLINSRANLHAVDKDKRTPLHLAASKGETEVAALLVNRGANLDADDKDCKTALDLAPNHHVLRVLTDTNLRLVSLNRLKCGLHKGVVHLTNIRLVLMGPPCVGKTSFKSLLFEWPPLKVRDSTALAMRPVRAIERVAECNDGKIWLTVTGLDLLKMLSDAIIAIENESVKNNPQISENANDSVLTVDPMSHLDENILLESTEQNFALEECDLSTNESPVPAEVASLQDHKPVQSGLDILHHTSNSPENDKTTAFEELTPLSRQPNTDHYSTDMVELLTKRKKSEDLHKATWINIVDSGGQPQFADVSRAFVHGNTMNIICTKLTEKLSDKPQFSYSLNGKLLSQPSELQMTNLQLIEHFVRSIVASKNAVVLKGNKRFPFFMIIGTYYDKMKGSKQKILEILHEKNEQILSTLHEFQDHFIFYKDNPAELIFPVDNLCWWNRKKISSYFRERIMSYKKHIGITVPIPVRYYMFEMRLTEEASQEEHGMVSFDSCCSIGVNLGMDRNDVLKSIIYLHSMALFLFFPKVLPNVIFTNPQYLIDMLSALIQFSFVESLEDILPVNQCLEVDAKQIFREAGVFDSSLLGKLCLPFVPNLFSEEKFLKLLRYLCILAPLSSNETQKQYFMPVVLPPCQITEEDTSVFRMSCDPMIIAFKTKVVPQGVFPAVVVALVTREEKPQFYISHETCLSTFSTQLRYAILLDTSVDLFGSVLLVDRFYWIEVYYTGLTKNCFRLRQVICEAISTCGDILAYEQGALKAEVTVSCQRQHQKTGYKLHPVLISYEDDPPSIRCSIEKNLPTLQLTNERQRCWLIDSTPLPAIVPFHTNIPDGPLDETHLYAVLQAVDDVVDWYTLGIYLGFRDSVLKAIKEDTFYQSEPGRRKMITIWLNEGRATKEALIKAVRDMKLHRIADKIAELPS